MEELDISTIVIATLICIIIALIVAYLYLSDQHAQLQYGVSAIAPTLNAQQRYALDNGWAEYCANDDTHLRMLEPASYRAWKGGK